MAINEKQQYASEINHHQEELVPVQSSWPYKDNIEPRRKNISRFVVRRKGKVIAATKNKKQLRQYELADELYDVDQEYAKTYFVDNKKGITIGEFQTLEVARKFAKQTGNLSRLRMYQPTDNDRDEELREARSDRNLHQQFAEETKGLTKRYLGRPDNDAE